MNDISYIEVFITNSCHIL